TIKEAFQTMSDVGQEPTFSPALPQVRSAPESGHPIWPRPCYGPCVDGSGLASRIFTLQHWSEQPCVRPLSAVLMTAGHNALRGSGPDRQHAFKDAMAQ